MTETTTRSDTDYQNGNPEDTDAIRQQARNDADAEIPDQTAEDFAARVKAAVTDQLEIVEELVVVEHDPERDEIYFSQDKYPRISADTDSIWFKTTATPADVSDTLAGIIDDADVEFKPAIDADDEHCVTVNNPHPTEAEREQRVQDRADELVRDRRDYIDVDESDLKGDCPNDDCTGKKYFDGYGSYGPRYRCTRKACGFRFERDVR